MATYEEIYGKRVKEFDSDPTLDSSYEGQVWYDKSSGVLKSIVSFDSFTSSTPLTTSRSNIAGMGTQTAALAAAGSVPPYSAACELYNGTGWANTTSNNTGRQTASSSGTSTAGLIAGGQASPGQGGYTNASEEFDGSSWTEGNNLNMTRAGLCGFGTQTAGVAAGGYGPPPSGTYQNATEEYDGTSWTAQNTFTTGAEALAGAGTQTAGLVFGGASPSNTTRTGEYDGTNWTAGGALNTARHALAGDGVQTSAIAIGGNTGSYTGAAEKYDGTSWTTSPATLGTSRANLAASHTSANNSTAVVFGGQAPSVTTATEEFSSSINTITAAAFSSSPTLSYSVDANLASAGSLTSAVAAGGYNAPAGPGTVSYIAKAATWNGTAWSNITDLPERRTNNNSVGATAPAFYVFGGQNQPGPSTNTYLTTTYTWNGSAWGSAPSLAESQSGGGACGTPSAIVLVGGVNAPSGGSIDDNIQQYDGSSWANSPVNYPTNVSGNGCVGTQTAAVIFGGYEGGSPFPGSGVTTTNEWNGSSISSGNAMVFGLLGCSGSGTQTAALSYGGRNTSGNKNAIGMIYDGTSWATQPSLSTARDYIAMGPMGSATNCLAVAGSGGAQSLVEEFTEESSAITASTLTSS